MGIRSCLGIYISILQDNGQKSKTEIHHSRMLAGTRRICGDWNHFAAVGTTIGRPQSTCAVGRTGGRAMLVPTEVRQPHRRGGYHPPVQRAPNPHAALRRIRSAFRVGGDALGAPLSDACRNPARCGHRALQGAAHPNRRGRRPRRPAQDAPIIMPTPGESDCTHRRAATCGPPRTGNETAGR